MNKESLKEKIGWYRHLFTFFSAVNFASVGWFVANFGKLIITGFLAMNILLIISSLISMFVLTFKIRKHIKKLGED